MSVGNSQVKVTSLLSLRLLLVLSASRLKHLVIDVAVLSTLYGASQKSQNLFSCRLLNSLVCFFPRKLDTFDELDHSILSVVSFWAFICDWVF